VGTLIRHSGSMRIRNRIQGSDDKQVKLLKAEKIPFLYAKLQFVYPSAIMETAQLQENPSALKRGHQTLQNMSSSLLSGSGRQNSIRIDPDPQLCIRPNEFMRMN
jgi:hypothetical protein